MTIDLFGYVGQDITLQSIKSNIENSPDDTILNLSTYGGSYAEGVAIYDYLLPKKLAINIIGVCASAGATIAMAAGKGKLSISENAEFMIHPVRTMMMGFYTENELDDEQSNLNIYNNTTKKIYQKRTGLESDVLDSLFSNEKTMNAEQALEYGFVDSITVYDEEDEVTNRLDSFVNMMKNINLNYNKVIADTKKLNTTIIPKQNKKQTTNENDTQINGDVSMTGKTENADVCIDTSKETINELTTQINALKNELSKKDNAIELQKRDEIINSMKVEIDNFKKKEAEKTNELIKENINQALANIENSKVEITDEFKTTITNCNSLDLSNTILGITEAYNKKFENTKIPEGDTPARKTNEKLVPSLPNTDGQKTINAYTDEKEFDALIEKVATDDFGGDDLKAINAIESNPDLYNVTFTRK